MDPFKKSVLDEFGQLLMADVYDRTCWVLERTFSGHMRGAHAQKMSDLYRPLDALSKEVVRAFASEAVTSAIAHFLNLFDEREIAIPFKTSSGETVNIQKLSDGLTGELYTEDGWIARFSKYKDGLRAAPEPPLE